MPDTPATPADSDDAYPHHLYDPEYFAHITRDSASARWRLRWLDAMLPVQPGDRIVELGCGGGRVSAHLAGHGAVVEAVDLAPDAVAYAAERWADMPNLTFRACDATQCDHLAGGAFDSAVSADVVEHVCDDTVQAMLDEAHRLLKPGGLFWLYSPNVRHWIERLKARCIILHQDASHTHVRGVPELVDALERVGFQIVTVARPTSMIPLVRWLEWLWIRQPLCPHLAIYRVAILARKKA
jgi:cyclopropane fatty-acyl-phospholipid synthase-like methyltransferase